MTILKKKKPIDYIIYSAVIIVGIILDQITKWLISSNMKINDTIPVIQNFFHITYITNDGAAFGMLDGPVARIAVMVVTTLLVIGFGIYLYLGHADNKLYGVAMAMVVSGGIGNMIDRLGFGFYFNEEKGIGEVIDFIDFRGIWDAIFNVADSFVCVGAGLLILALVIDLVKEAKAKNTLSKEEADAKSEEISSDEDGKAE